MSLYYARVNKGNFLTRGFFKDRGYRDSSELTKHEIRRLPEKPHSQSFVYDAKKIFDKPDTAKLKNGKILNAAGAFLELNPFGIAVVVASTGRKGDSDENLVLSQARAMVVRDYLTENFRFDDTQIKTMGLGEGSDPGASNRVQILVYPVDDRAPPVSSSLRSTRSRTDANRN